MSTEELETLAALHAAGALDGEERRVFEARLASGEFEAKEELRRFREVAARVALACAPVADPPAGLRERVLGAVRSRAPVAAAVPPVPDSDGLHFVMGSEEDGWQALPVPGARVKLLSLVKERGYAVVLGKLDPGAQYPPHRHLHAEQVFVLSGDLSIGERRLGPGDFHQADAGTWHRVNRSEAGCTILAVISIEDLMAQQQGVPA
ncbi:MAG: cupin domain-containing protein [Verrucomicrobiae bacterium]|nr:cupin domain-containing protein [Verrucomicrobiae bacterium]